MKVSRKLLAEWAGKLKASGFQDAEGPDGITRDWGRLSRRGCPTFESNETDTRHITPEALAENEIYYENAREIARSYRFRSVIDRDVWALHAERLDDRKVSERLGISYRQARQSVRRTFAATMREARKGMSPISPSRVRDRKKVDRLVSEADPELLLAIVGGLA